MVRMEITKVILTRGEDWALVEYRTKEGRGTCGGKFGCSAAQIVAGQFYSGMFTSKRARDGSQKRAFKGSPLSRLAHALKFAFKQQGIGYVDRSAIFSHMKPFDSLIHALKERKSASLMNVPKIGRKKLMRLYSAYDSVSKELNVSMEFSKVFPKLHEYMSKSQMEAAIKWRGSMDKLVKYIHADPWRIMYDTEYDSFQHISEKRSEFISATTTRSRTRMVELAAADLRLLRTDSRAKRAMAIHTIKQYMTQTGNYWMPLHMFKRTFETIEPTWPCVVHDRYIALSRYAEVESFLQKTFDHITKTYVQCQWVPPDPSVQLDACQRQAVIQACESPLFILQGGAGVGKTTVCRHIVKSLKGKVVCAAPTGKAAQRLAEVTGVPSFTVHRLFYMSDIEQLPHTLLLDEQSMQEPEILALLLSKRSFRKIIFVGDTAQLTSVGPGQFFRDICDSSIPKMELTKIYRSGPKSYIATNGQKIRVGDTSLDTSPESFMVYPFTSNEDIVSKSREIYESTGEMPMVLCNTNAEVCQLNPALREICNPIGNKPHSRGVSMDYFNKQWRYPNWCFGVGDSVINITNKYVEAEQSTKVLQVANGEIGKVLHASADIVRVKFESVVTFSISDDSEEHCSARDYLRPAYALTVNKAQGSEYPVVIIKSASSWGDKRERFYTAVTRAKEKCIVYEVGSANTDCIRAKPARRKTFLMKNT